MAIITYPLDFDFKKKTYISPEAETADISLQSAPYNPPFVGSIDTNKNKAVTISGGGDVIVNYGESQNVTISIPGENYIVTASAIRVVQVSPVINLPEPTFNVTFKTRQGFWIELNGGGEITTTHTIDMVQYTKEYKLNYSHDLNTHGLEYTVTLNTQNLSYTQDFSMTTAEAC